MRSPTSPRETVLSVLSLHPPPAPPPQKKKKKKKKEEEEEEKKHQKKHISVGQAGMTISSEWSIPDYLNFCFLKNREK